jgi:hypothetical protein
VTESFGSLPEILECRVLRRQTPAGDPDRRGHASRWREARTWSTSVSRQGPRTIKALSDASDKFK